MQQTLKVSEAAKSCRHAFRQRTDADYRRTSHRYHDGPVNGVVAKLLQGQISYAWLLQTTRIESVDAEIYRC
jgi:hypothetical protein